MSETLRTLKSPSVIALIAANTIPILGAIFLDWTIFSLMFLFWLENIIIGMFNVIKMLTAVPVETADPGSSKGARAIMLAGSIFMACFFTVHYGGFCMGHGVFVFAMFGKEAGVSVSALNLGS